MPNIERKWKEYQLMLSKLNINSSLKQEVPRMTGKCQLNKQIATIISFCIPNLSACGIALTVSSYTWNK
jgi:hypothetical protein